MVSTRCCSFSTRVVLGTSPRRWPLGMFALTSSSPPGATFWTNPVVVERALTDPIVGAVTISTNLVVVELALLMSINPAVPSNECTCKLSLPLVASVWNVVLERLRSNCAFEVSRERSNLPLLSRRKWNLLLYVFALFSSASWLDTLECSTTFQHGLLSVVKRHSIRSSLRMSSQLSTVSSGKRLRM